MDSINLSWTRFNLNIFQNYRQVRKTALGAAVVSGILWAVCGFDSTPLQFVHVLYEFVLSFGRLSLAQMIETYNLYYGKEMHYSAFVIYFAQFAFLSRYFEKRFNWTKSRNVVYSAGLVFLSIATFEYFWIYSYSFWQNQPWTSKWEMPQLRILLQNLGLMIAGVLTVFYMWIDSFLMKGKDIIGKVYGFRVDVRALVLILLTAGLAVLWIFYPWHVEHITVIVDGQPWINSARFPQTLYTVDLNTTDGLNAGVWYWIQNDAVHALNTGLKAIWTLTITYLGAVRKRESSPGS